MKNLTLLATLKSSRDVIFEGQISASAKLERLVGLSIVVHSVWLNTRGWDDKNRLHELHTQLHDDINGLNDQLTRGIAA